MSFRLSTRVGGLELPSPVIAASGVLPHDPSIWSSPYVEGVGGICTKGITLLPRSGNRGIRIWETPCGVLNSIGLENPGIEAFLERDLPRLAEAKGGRRLIVNLAAESEEELRAALERLSRAQGVDVLELNLSCPNVERGGMLLGSSPEATGRMVALARSMWRGPLWVKLTPQAPDLEAVALSAQEAGADAVVALNTWLGAAVDVRGRRMVFERKVAGLSGPAVLPLTVRVVYQLCGLLDVPVIACGGIARAEDAISCLMAGARAVEVGSAILRDLGAASRISEGIGAFLDEEGFSSVEELVGLARR